jgi:glycosyltransferase involved in cell wall biosynthesis
MHVIVFEKTPSSQLGGQELNMYEISNALAQRGHSVSLVYLAKGDLLPKYKLFCKNIVSIERYFVKEKTIRAYFQFLLGLRNDIRKIPITDDSIIFCNDFSSVFFGSILARLNNLPLVYHVLLPAYEFKVKWRPGLARVDRFIVCSKQTKESWVRLGIPETKAELVYNGANVEIFQPASDLNLVREELGFPNSSEDAMIVSFIGRLNLDKGIEVAIKAIALAVRQGIKIHLFIIGSPVLDPKYDSLEARVKYKQSLEQLAIELGAEEFIHFLGRVSNTAKIHQASDVTVVPSIWSDPFPRVVIESLAAGTPVVASSVGGIPEQLMPPFKDWLFEAGDHVQLLEKLLSLKNWRCSRPHIGQDCRQHVLDNFSDQKMMDKIEHILLNVAKNC